MIKKLKRMITGISLSLALFAPFAVPAIANAQVTEQFCRGSNYAAENTESTDCNASGSDGQLNDIVRLVVDTFSWIVGIISVIMIVYGGFRYITSGGDSSKVTNAKNTIIYAIIGLVIVAAAQFIVNFVVQKATIGGSTV